MKLYDSILSGLRAFFGMDADASESELQQALADAGSIEKIKEKAHSDAKAEFEATVSGLEQKITANADAVSSVKTELETLKSELKAAQDALQLKESELQESKAKVQELSTELADLKVSSASAKPIEKVDSGLEQPGGKSTSKSNAKVIDNAAFASWFN